MKKDELTKNLFGKNVACANIVQKIMLHIKIQPPIIPYFPQNKVGSQAPTTSLS